MKWNLRLAAANRGIWKASELQRMLAEAGLTISAGKMSGLWSGRPASIKLDDLDVICAVIGCGVEELLIPEPVKSGQVAFPAAPGPNRTGTFRCIRLSSDVHVQFAAGFRLPRACRISVTVSAFCRVAAARCRAAAPSEPHVHIPMHTAQASPKGAVQTCRGAGSLLAPVARRWQDACTRRVSSGDGPVPLAARFCLVIALRVALSHCSHSRGLAGSRSA